MTWTPLNAPYAQYYIPGHYLWKFNPIKISPPLQIKILSYAARLERRYDDRAHKKIMVESPV